MEQDQDVNNLLESWGLSQYKEKFAANNIDINTLGLLTADLTKELIRPIGDRARFSKNLLEWNFLTNSLQRSSSSIDDLIEIIPGKEAINDDDDDNNDNYVDVLSEKHRNIQLNAPTTSAALKIDLSCSPKPINIDFGTFEIKSTNSKTTALEDLLKKSLDGRALINLYSGSGILSNTGRRKICNIIIKNLLEADPNKRIESSTLLQYAQEIKTIFVKENISTYFVPYFNNSKLKIKRCAKGKLYDCLQNRKREYRESSLIKKSKQNTEEKNDTDETLVPDSDIIDDVTWLKNSCDPWPSVEEKWIKTAEYRRRELHNSQLTIQKYMDTYPALKKPSGFNLLMSDFKSQYPDSDNNLVENFPLHKNKILDLTVQKYHRHPDHNLKAFTEEYVNFLKKEDPVSGLLETTCIYAFMSLPLLLGNPVAKNKKKTWRPSKQESREAFITHIKAASELQETIIRRKEKYAAHGLTFQPTIFIVGPSLREIRSYYIVVNDTLYTVHSIVEAVDVTFKLFYSLNCEYPTDCISVYYFLQRGFYQITTKWDKEYISVNALLADLNMLNT